MSITINVLIATIGKPILQRMINCLADQLTENDCLTTTCVLVSFASLLVG